MISGGMGSMASMNFWMITEMIGAFRHLFLICILEN